MHEFMDRFMDVLEHVNGVIWHDYVLYTVLGVGVLFTFWSGFCQYRALTHGVAVTRGKYDDKNDPGAINHFQALSAALSATVGLGNIGGVALAIALGGPGAVFWMWMIGLAGMALKTTEVTLSMLYRNTDDPDNPHGGPMFVASKAFKQWGLGPVGKLVGGIFVVTLLISAITGGNMFQAWNVGVVTESNFGIPQQVIGAVLVVVVGLVIVGGIKRIGAVAGKLVPLMCTLYLLAALWVIFLNFGRVPEMLMLIVRSAFNPLEAQHAFLGGTAGYAFLWGMKRALFSSEAGQGSSPIAHSAAKTNEPVREAVVAGLEPFIDTIVVCTLTTLVVLLSGAWNRAPEAVYTTPLAMTNAAQVELADGSSYTGVVITSDSAKVGFLRSSPGIGQPHYVVFDRADVASVTELPDQWIPDTGAIPEKSATDRRISGPWGDDDPVFVVYEGELDPNTGRRLHRLAGSVQDTDAGLRVAWVPVTAPEAPVITEDGIYGDYVGAALTSHAFDRVTPGLGKWLVTIASWLFAISTMISWSYYGEQGVVFLFGSRAVMGYKLVYLALILVACAGFIQTDAQLDALTALGTGVMLWANIPIMLIFGVIAMKAYHSYFRRLKAGEFHPHAAPKLSDVVEGKDVE